MELDKKGIATEKIIWHEKSLFPIFMLLGMPQIQPNTFSINR